ncbi:MAG: sensor histidine kinase, partial [Sphaerospermopsis kisseleviana]
MIGFLTIIEYSFNVNLGIDELIIRESQNIPATSTPGRMSPNTAICLFLLGLALIARSQKLFHLIQFLALIIFLIALLRLVSYGLGISNLYLLNSFTTMALHTSIAFILISVGILLNDPQKGWMEVVMSSYLGGIIARRLLPIVISIPILTTGLFLFTYRSNIFNIENGFLIRAMMNILVLAMVVWWNARYLNAIDKKHQKSQEQLQQAYENLEICVQQRTLQLKNMNDDLQKSRSKLSNLINTLPGIVFSRSQNLDWSIDNISNGCLAITGYSKAVLIRGSYPSFQDLIVPEDIEKIAHVIEKSLDENLPYEIEYRILTKSGSEKYLWEKGMPTSSCDGEKTPAIEGFIIDITSRKQAEAALRESETKVRELNDQLEQRVQKRTSELIAVNKELESFSYSVSHDLRSPLRAINGFSRILLERYQDTLDSKGEHYLNRICNATVQMSRLIDDILKLSRVTRGELHLTQVNLSQIAQEIIQELTETKPERQVKWLITPNLIVNGDR